MEQVLQNLKTGATEVVTVPKPVVKPGSYLIRATKSLVSAGTERMLVEFGRANLLQKARQQPDKVRQVLDKVRTDGLAPTLQTVQAKLDQPLPLGYSNVGQVVECGDGATAIQVGDRVVSNGHHAGFVCVPENLCAKLPDTVDDESASFTVLAAIALQGIRLARPTLGENVVVVGLGLIGLLAVQLLRANGCRVLGIDFDRQRAELAKKFGAETVVLSQGQDPLSTANCFSAGKGVDAVIITASSKSNEPVSQAASMCRKRGRIVLVGVVGLELSRSDFYEKELSFQVSCSYGPGRYDPLYEEQGHDYPLGFVRWTEQRNFEAVLELMASGRLDVKPLISHRFAIDKAADAYRVLEAGSPLGIVLEYSSVADAEDANEDSRVDLLSGRVNHVCKIPGISFIGAGNYAGQVLIPAFRSAGVNFDALVSAGGVSSVHNGKKFGFRWAATKPTKVWESAETDAVVIATRHETHADYVIEAISNRKHVFCEKPLAITREQLTDVESAYIEAVASGFKPCVMVGFNRRFAPQVVKLRTLLAATPEPKSIIMTVNAGEIPADHWTQDPLQGGGRIIGEGCHFVDLLRFLVGAPIKRVNATCMGSSKGVLVRDDKAIITLEFDEGSFGAINYLANGHRSFPKERLEVFSSGAILQIDNFRRMTGYGWPGFRKFNLRGQDKGQAACAAAFVNALQGGGEAPIPFSEIVEVTKATFDAYSAMRSVG